MEADDDEDELLYGKSDQTIAAPVVSAAAPVTKTKNLICIIARETGRVEVTIINIINLTELLRSICSPNFS